VKFFAELLQTSIKNSGIQDSFAKENFKIIVTQNKIMRMLLVKSLILSDQTIIFFQILIVNFFKDIRTVLETILMFMFVLGVFNLIMLNFIIPSQEADPAFINAPNAIVGIFFSITLIIFIIFLFFGFLGAIFRFKLKLWYQCCLALNVDRREIVEIVGEWAMPAFEKENKIDDGK